MKLEFHHINFVSPDVDKMHDFYTGVLGLDDIAPESFPRTQETDDRGYSGKIRFATDGGMQMHLAERNLDVAFKNGHTINPVDRGHIAATRFQMDAFGGGRPLVPPDGNHGAQEPNRRIEIRLVPAESS